MCNDGIATAVNETRINAGNYVYTTRNEKIFVAFIRLHQY